MAAYVWLYAYGYMCMASMYGYVYIYIIIYICIYACTVFMTMAIYKATFILPRHRNEIFNGFNFSWKKVIHQWNRFGFSAFCFSLKFFIFNIKCQLTFEWGLRNSYPEMGRCVIDAHNW